MRRWFWVWALVKVWPAIALSLGLVSAAAPARAADCDGKRRRLQDEVTAALKGAQSAQCSRLRKIFAETEDCRDELTSFRTEVETRIKIRCNCPDQPKAVLQHCRDVSKATCDGNVETGILQCIYEVQRLRGCPNGDAPEREVLETKLTSTYGGCPRCADSQAAIGSLASNLKTCDAVRAAKQTRSALLACPQVTGAALSNASAAIEARATNLVCPDPSLARRLYGEIDTLNRQIKETKDCSTSENCADLEAQRLFSLSAYLELVRVQAPEDFERARDLLRGVGTDPSLAEMTAKYGPEAVRVAGVVSGIFNSSTSRDQFLGQLKEAHLEELAAAMERDKGSLDSFMKVFLRAQSAEQARALNLADSLEHSGEEFETLIRTNVHRFAWRLWLPEEQDECETCGGFVAELLRLFKGASIARGKTQADFYAHLRERHGACKKELAERSRTARPPSEHPCGVLLKVLPRARGENTEVSGDLYFVDGARPLEALESRQIRLPPFLRGHADRTAAVELARKTLTSVSTFRAAWSGTEPPAPPVPSPHCGVTSSYAPDFGPAPVGEGLQIQGDCDHPETALAVRDALAGNQLVGWVRQTSKVAPSGSPRLILERHPNGSLEWCSGELRSAKNEVLYVVKATVDGGQSCPESAEARWRYAGEDIARLVGNYYAQPLHVTVDTKPPPAGSTSSGWYALGFAGAPYLQDSRATTWSKVVSSALDGGLLIASGVAFGIAVDYRNDYARDKNTDSLGRSTDWLNAGVGLAIGWFANRALSGIGYAYGGTIWQKSQR